MHVRRVLSISSIIEQLEGRALPSAVAPLQSTYEIERSASFASAAVFVSTTVEYQAAGTSITPTDGSGVVDQDRETRTGSANEGAGTSAARSNLDVTTGNKTATSRQLISRADSHSHFPRTSSSALGVESAVQDHSASGQETVFGGNGGATSDLADAATSVGQDPDAIMPVLVSLGTNPGSLLGSDSQSNDWRAGPTLPDVAGNAVPKVELAGRAWPGRRTPTTVERAELLQVVGLVVVSENESAALAGLLEGALHPDWKSVEREVRNFLAGLRGLGDDMSGSNAIPVWPMALGAVAGALLAHRASVRRRLTGRPGSGALWRPVPLGPWPLGPV